MIEATGNPEASKEQLLLCAENGGVAFEVEAAAAGDAKTPRFKLVGYTGGKMHVAGWYDPVVVDLKGLEMRQSKPIYLQHYTGDLEYLLGQTDSIKVVSNTLVAEGPMFDESETAKRVIALSKKGFKWQASIGARVLETVRLKEGEKMKVNGQTVEGPAVVATKSTLGEISFVMLGADENSSAQIAAKNLVNKETGIMKEKGKAQETSEVVAGQEAGEKTVEASAAKNPETKPENKKVEAKAQDAPNSADEHVAQIRATAAAEYKRIDAIAKVCKGEHPEIQAKAVADGWTPDRAELEVLRASRPSLPGVMVPAQVDNFGHMLEAAAIMAGGVRGDDLLKKYGEQTVEAADKQFRHGIGLQQLFLEAAWQNGCSVRFFRDDPRKVLQAAFSTFDVSGILSNIANKFLLEGFMTVEEVWRQIAAIRPVKDFKTVTSYRLSGAFEYDQVGPDGELKHGDIDEASFTNQAKTYGKMFSITRQDLINDDLGALTVIPRRIGRGGHLKLNLVFWTAFLDNATFFASGNSNYMSGAASALSLDALTAAELLFLNQTDDDGKPLAVQPKTLLVPNALKVLARRLCHDLEIRNDTDADGDAKSYTTSNPHAGKWNPIASSYLGNSAITGYSTAAFYLLADPNDVPVIEVAFLNGVQNPTVESADADFNTLGVQMRGYFDFGVSKQDPKGGVKSLGAAE